MKYVVFIVSVMLTASIFAQGRRSGLPWTTRSEVIARQGMVCSSHPLATQVGIDILKKGGTAVDAAIAVNACLGLMEPTGSGVGGDLFAIVWDAKTQKLYGLNSSGPAPKSISIEALKAQGITQIPSFGALPVSVPGCVDGWFELNKRFGALPISELLQPAIDYANNGFPLTEVIAPGIRSTVARFEKLYPNIKETYTPNGEIWEKGDVYRNPMLAKTLKLIAEKGRDEFYKGSIAAAISSFIQSQGGFLNYEDLASYKAEWIDPVSTNYRGYDVWELPPNGQGIAALQMLNILEHYDLQKYGFGSPEHIHYFVEAKKLAFEDRAKYYADPRFNEVPVNTLISKEYAAERFKNINDGKAAQNPQAGVISNTNNTIYLTVADKDGNMVSFIQSNFRGMGSGMVPPGLGFMLQNRGELFSLDKNHANALLPGKRPFHTIIPAFVTKDGKPFMSFGVMGGDFQPLGHVQIILNIIDFGMNLQEAGDAPRIDHAGSTSPVGEAQAANGGDVILENGFPAESVRRLLEMGHHVSYGFGESFGGYQAIRYDPVTKVYYGASESRKDGCAMGY
ncbi:MAG: gamma-glutamyltransferase [Tannerella sp.]|jgi:gamma-glutamyltranspeptidase/glutathione hydrolase|nr:gamma-glutamyltransferase [Tannerella sp.]